VSNLFPCIPCNLVVYYTLFIGTYARVRMTLRRALPFSGHISSSTNHIYNKYLFGRALPLILPPRALGSLILEEILPDKTVWLGD
jgi:hypothetical protein